LLRLARTEVVYSLLQVCEMTSFESPLIASHRQ
jgi:hypothetical protein